MSLLFLESFDNYSASSTNALIANRWRNSSQIVGLSVTTIPSPVHNHGQSVVLNAGSDNLQLDFPNMENFPSENITGVVGFHFRITNFTLSSTVPIIGWLNENSVDYQITLRHDTAGQLQLYRANSTFLAAGSTLSLNTWYHLETKWRISNSIPGNSFIVRLDGVNDIVLAAGTDTQGQSDSKCGGLKWPGAASKTKYLDNIYVCDLQGSINNDFIGPAFIENIRPAGNGTVNQWDGSDGDSVNNYLLVDEVLNDDNSTYVKTSTNGERDRYDYPLATGNIGIIRGINIMTRGRKTTTAPSNLTNLAHISGTQYAQSQYPLHNEFRYFDDILETNPETNENWTNQQLNENEFGILYEV